MEAFTYTFFVGPVGRRHRIVKDPRLTRLVAEIVKQLRLNYIDLSRVAVVRNLDSSSPAFARIHSVSRPIAVAFDLGPLYAIEVIDKNFEKLDCLSKLKVLIHELMHIPKSFSGSLVPHRSHVFSESNLSKLLMLLDTESLCRDLEYK